MLDDEEYLEKYQKIYGNLTEEQKAEVLKEDDISLGALDDLQ